MCRTSDWGYHNEGYQLDVRLIRRSHSAIIGGQFRRLFTALDARPAISALDEVGGRLALVQKMLLEQLKELIDYGFVQKKSFEGYPLHVEYSLTSDMGEQILEALRIMQHIGIDYLKANGMEHILEEKGVVPD